MEAINRFKGLDLADRVPKPWVEVHYLEQGAVTRTIPKKKKCNKAKGCLRRPYKEISKEEKQKASEKGKDIPN